MFRAGCRRRLLGLIRLVRGFYPSLVEIGRIYGTFTDVVTPVQARDERSMISATALGACIIAGCSDARSRVEIPKWRAEAR